MSNFTKEIGEIQKSADYRAVITLFQNNSIIKNCNLALLEAYSQELDTIVQNTKVSELNAGSIDKINASLVSISAHFARVSELKIYFLRLNVEWKRHFPLLYAKFDSHEWIRTFRNKETRQAIIDEVFEDYAFLAVLTKFLIEKCDLLLDQFRTFTFNLRDQRENLKVECQFFMSNTQRHPET